MRRLLCLVFGLFAFLLAVQAGPTQALPAQPRPAQPRRQRGGPARLWPGQGDPAVERARECLLDREGGRDYQAEDPSHQWFGAYQFQLRTSNFAARRMRRPDLLGVPASRWAPEDQDAAFYVVYDRGRGKQHWAGGNFPCF